MKNYIESLGALETVLKELPLLGSQRRFFHNYKANFIYLNQLKLIIKISLFLVIIVF